MFPSVDFIRSARTVRTSTLRHERREKVVSFLFPQLLGDVSELFLTPQ